MHTVCTPSSHGTLSSKVLLWDDESPEFELSESAANSMFGVSVYFVILSISNCFRLKCKALMTQKKINTSNMKGHSAVGIKKQNKSYVCVCVCVRTHARAGTRLYGKYKNEMEQCD